MSPPYQRLVPPQTLAPANAYRGYVERSFAAPPPPHTPLGSPSPTVRRVLATRCAGYAAKPTPEEVCRCLTSIERARGCPSPARAWLTEASLEEIIDAWLEGAYRLDALAEALRVHPTRRNDRELLAWLNTLKQPHAQPD